MIGGYSLQCKIGGKELKIPVEYVFELYETIYGVSKYVFTLTYLDPSMIDSVISDVEKEKVEIRWGEFSDKEPGWSEWREIEVLHLLVNIRPVGFDFVIKAVDKTTLMKNQYPRRQYKDKTVKTILSEIASDYNLELDIEVDSDPMNFFQCDNSDYGFIENILIPKAKQYRLASGGKLYSLLFYVDKGKKLVIKPRKCLPADPIKFMSSPSKEGMYIGSFTASLNLTPDLYSTIGETVDFLTPTDPFFYRQFESEELDVVYDEFGFVRYKVEKGPSRARGCIVKEVRQNADVNAMVKSEMSLPKLYKKNRLAIPSPVIIGLELGRKATVDYKKMFCTGTYLVYAFFTKVAPEGSYSVTFMERASND